MKIVFLFPNLLLLFLQLAGAQIPVTENEAYSIRIQKEDLYHASGDFAITDLLNAEVPMLPFIDNTSFEEDTSRWFRADIRYSAEPGRLYVYTFKNDYADVFLVRDGVILQQAKSGYLYNNREKQINNSSYYVHLTIREPGDYQIYVKISRGFHKIIPEFKLTDESTYNRNIATKYAFSVGFQGILLIMIIYGILVYLNFKDKAYLFYSLHLLMISIFFMVADGLLRDIIFTETPLYSYIFVLPVIIAPVFYYSFIRDFLEIGDLLPRAENFFRWLLFLHVICCLLGILLFFTLENKEPFALLVKYVIALDCIIGLSLSYTLSLKSHKLIKYFIYGSLVLFVSAFIDVMQWSLSENDGLITRLGIIGEILFFSLGLGRKMRLVEQAKRRVQFQLMHQLRSNKESAERRQVELEKQVAIRTQELSEQTKHLIKARDAAEEASRAKTDFLSVMSHEIRTPMNGVIGMTHILLQDDPKPEQVENLKALKFSAENLLLLLNDVLDYNKIESGMLQLDQADFSINRVFSSLGYQFNLQAKAKGLRLLIDLPADIPEWYRGDPSRINQVLTNLVSNAVKFTHQGQVKVSLELTTAAENTYDLHFKVADTGIGIESDKLEMVFNRFTQASSRTSRTYGGTGLGLSITLKLLKLMGSHIRLSSEPGKGSEFSFTLNLPAGKPQPYYLEQSEEQAMISALKNTRALIVDDNLMNRMVLEKFLNKWGMTFVSTEGGKEALQAVKEQQFDIVLLDIQMPEMDGFTVARTMRNMTENTCSKIPVLALSADIFANVYHDLLSSGMDDFISKPLDPKELLAAMYKHRMRSTLQ